MPTPFVFACGGSLEAAADAVVRFLRVIWSAASDHSHWRDGSLVIETRSLSSELPELAPACLERLVEGLPRDAENPRLLSIGLADLGYRATVKRLLSGAARDRDIRYLALRSIRRTHGVRLSSFVLHELQLYARVAAALIESSEDGASLPSAELRARIEGAREDSSAGSLAEAYIEAGLLLEFLTPGPEFQKLFVQPRAGDAEYLLSHLFGVPSSIRGFDDLFGGGGLMLLDTEPDLAAETVRPTGAEPIGSRTVLTIGPFGSGKSLLSLQMAVEVARKGGVAWFMALEQSEDECLYALEAIGVSTQDDSFEIVRGLGSVFVALTKPAPAKGSLIFLRPGEDSWIEFLKTITGQLSWMRQYSLRLLVVDPVNALLQGERKDADLRGETRKLFADAKKARVNVWLTSELPEAGRSQDDFAENIADTVIHLGAEPEYQKRYLRITKSRLQGEQSGRHAMAIEGGRGIRIDMSSAAPQRLAPPPVRGLEPNPPLRFGVPGMDELLGTDKLQPGDIIALAGPGKSKTLLGGDFLRARGSSGDSPQNGGARRRSVFVSDYSPERTRNFLDELFPRIEGREDDRRNQGRGIPPYARRREDVRYCAVSPGYVDPARVLQDIEDALERARGGDGSQADRVLITNIARWEREMPLLAADSTFGVALINLLRRYRVAAVLVCGDDLARGQSRLRDVISDSCDFLLEFNRVQSRGLERTFVRAVKTRFMRHPRIAFELMLDGSGLSVAPAPMLNINAAGEVKPVRIRLFLHSETENHQRYNDRLAGALRTSVSPDTRLAKQSEHYDPTILSMTRLSAVDELQIIQLDEFQLPHAAALLSQFPAARGRDLLDDRIPDLLRNVFDADRDKFIAVPFYENISLLAHTLDQLPPSWEDLARLCDNPQPPLKENEVVFACPVYEEAVETYNCMFLEILQTLRPRPVNGAGDANGDCELLEWLSSPEAVEAALLFRRLCCLSHLNGYRKKVKPVGRVARHWYNTLNQELSDREPAERQGLQVTALYGGVSTAGEWYLAVPAYSASPDVGLEIIRNLTTPGREMERLYMGVGLPTRRNFYEGGADSEMAAKAATSRYFRFAHDDLKKLVGNALRRSRFGCYQSFASTLSSHLLWVLEIPGAPKERGVRDEVELAMSSLVSSMSFLRQSLPCCGSS